MELKEIAKYVFLDALEIQHPSKLIDEEVDVEDHSVVIAGDRWSAGGGTSVYIIGVGKASRPMVKSLKKKLEVSDAKICCITPDKNAGESYCIASSHPVPDQKSKKAAEKLIYFIDQIPSRSLILFALSGGASALLCKPAEGLELTDINSANQLLLKSGANIEEVNGVRKHLSAVKGGQLLRHFKPDCTLIDLVISDVPSDNLEIIGSGPTTLDSSTFQDAYDTLLRYELWDEVTAVVRVQIEKGLTGEIPETIKPGNDPLQNHSSFIIGSAKIFARQIAEEVRKKGFKSWVADVAFNHPVEKVAENISQKINQHHGNITEDTALVFFGESTVKVTGGGKGGRNQELALRGALKIEGMKRVTWLSAGTDGIDGPTDAAGAIVVDATIADAKKNGLDANEFLRNNDSYHFHEQMGTLLKTGPTGNNVMDAVIILIKA